jgi:DNA-binding LytR/AlgR family response regulator
MKLECLIVDDEPIAVQLLADYISKIPTLSLRASCFNAFEVLKFLENTKVDIIFLDINMPNLSGMELMGVLPERQRVIFTTAYSEFALESYEYNTIDYLLKPISFKRFTQAIMKAENSMGELPITPSTASKLMPSSSEFMFVKSDKQFFRIKYEDVVVLEAQREYVCIRTLNKKILVYKRMKEVEEKLPASFIRIHNSYIINVNFITKIEGNYVQLGQDDFPIGISYREIFFKFLHNKTM